MTTPTLHQAAQMAEDTLAALWDRHAGGKLNIDSACPAFIDRAQKTITALRAALAQSAAPAVPNGAYPECSGDPNSCPENEGHGCCRESTAPAVPDDIAAIIACLGDDAALLRETTDDSEEIAQNMDDAAAALERLSAAPAVREVRNYAIGYAILRNAPIDAIKSGGVFAGRTPDNVVINGVDLDAATFGAAAQQSIDQQVESINAVFDAWRNGEDASMTLALSAPPADGDRVEAAIDDYIDGYVMEGDDGYYQPNDGDTAMLKDAMMGLLVDPGFLAAYDGTPPATPQAVPAPAVPLTDEMDAVASKYAHKMALDLECVLSDYNGKWWDTAINTLGEYRMAMNRIHERESPTHMGEPVLPKHGIGGGGNAT